MKLIGSLLLCVVIACVAPLSVGAAATNIDPVVFHYAYGTDYFGDTFTEILDESYINTVLEGERLWVELSETEKEKIDSLFLQKNGRTYSNFLAEAKDWDALRRECEGKTGTLDSIPSFMQHCATDEKGSTITKVTPDNLANVVAGAIIWDELAFPYRMAINQQLKKNGQPPYQDLIAEAEVLMADILEHPEKYTTTTTNAKETTAKTSTTKATTTTATTTTTTRTTQKTIEEQSTKTTQVTTGTAATTITLSVTTTVESESVTTISSASALPSTTVTTYPKEEGHPYTMTIILVCGIAIVLSAATIALVVQHKK